MRLLRDLWDFAGIGDNVRSRLEFITLLATLLGAGFVYLRDRAGVMDAGLLVLLGFTAIAFVISLIRAARSDERHHWQARVGTVEKAAADRVEDERRRTEDRMRSEIAVAVDRETASLRKQLETATAGGVCIPRTWNAIVTGHPTRMHQRSRLPLRVCTS